MRVVAHFYDNFEPLNSKVKKKIRKREEGDAKLYKIDTIKKH